MESKYRHEQGEGCQDEPLEIAILIILFIKTHMFLHCAMINVPWQFDFIGKGQSLAMDRKFQTKQHVKCMVNQRHNKDRLQYPPSKPTPHKFNVSKNWGLFFSGQKWSTKRRNIKVFLVWILRLRFSTNLNLTVKILSPTEFASTYRGGSRIIQHSIHLYVNKF